MLTLEAFQAMSEEEQDSCTSMQIIQMYLKTCLMTEADMPLFFGTLLRDDISLLNEPLNGNWMLLAARARYVFIRALKWHQMHRPHSNDTIRVMCKTLLTTLAPPPS